MFSKLCGFATVMGQGAEQISKVTKFEKIVQVTGTTNLENLAAEDQCSTKFSELENLAAGKKYLGTIYREVPELYCKF